MPRSGLIAGDYADPIRERDYLLDSSMIRSRQIEQTITEATHGNTRRCTERRCVLPQRLTGHIGGESVPGSDLSVKLPIYYPVLEALFELQEDGAEAVAAAVSCARDISVGYLVGLPVAEQQRIFRAIAALIRANADLLALEECLCAGCRRRIWHRGRCRAQRIILIFC